MRATKPDKPYKDFPLTAHPNGTWCKKIKGKLHHFGGWADPAAALAKYRHQVDDLQAGRQPESMPNDNQLTLIDLCNEFLDSKELLVQSGELSRQMHFDYLRSCERVTGILGRNRVVENLKPKDFDELRSKLADGVSKVTLSNRVRLARILFKFAHDQGFVTSPLKFGQNFKLPDKATLRAERNKSGPKMFEADELRAIIDGSAATLRAQVLLGINCGFGNNDCATLPQTAINLEAGWIDFPRPKTHIGRRCPLWPETVSAIREYLKTRPAALDVENERLTFITRHGMPYVRLTEKGTALDAVAGEFSKVLVKLKLNGNRRAFYSLRRTFETIGGNCRDQVAVDFIMGHTAEADDMGAVYRQRIDDQRLQAVADHVRAWLWPKIVKRDE